MYWIAFLVWGVFLMALGLSRKEEVGNTSRLLKPFCKVAMYLYKRFTSRFPGWFVSSQVEKDLIQLYPGESAEYLKMEYCVKKMALCLAIVIAGTLLGAAARFGIDSSRILEEGGMVKRGDFREGIREIKLMAAYGGDKMSFRVQVEPRRLSEEETGKVFDGFLEKLPELILGENESLHSVTSDLNLKESYPGYPISVEWESGKDHILGDDGCLYSVEQEERIILAARLSCGGYERETEICIMVQPPEYGEEERCYMEMEELLRKSQKDSLEKEEWVLPSKWKGEDIRWREVVEDDSLFLWFIVLAAAVMVYLFKDRDLHERLEKRKKELRREYPDILHKLVLFIGAGMTVRGALQRMAADYETKRAHGGRPSPACEEMLYACRELQAGVSEGKAYERLGRRTGLQEYIRMSTLLLQNLKRGNAALLERLREEADNAAAEQLQQCRKLGEEAGTKLLIPMVLMLAVVMTVIMLPAFSTI